MAGRRVAIFHFQKVSSEIRLHVGGSRRALGINRLQRLQSAPETGHNFRGARHSTGCVLLRLVLTEMGLWLCSVDQVTLTTRRSHIHLRGFNLKADLLMFYMYLILTWRSKESNYSSSNKNKNITLHWVLLCLVQELKGRACKQFSKKISLFRWVCINSIFFLEKLKLFLFLLCVHLLECL